MHKFLSYSFVAIGLMLFKLFFGAGNLIFPVFLGQNAGWNVPWATIGFLITGVGLPLLGIVAMCYSGSCNLQELAGRVHPLYGLIFTVALYLTIGPCFAIPRTGTVTYEMAIVPFISPAMHDTVLYGFAFIYFAICWWFSMTPSKLVYRIGKIATPAFLFFLAILIIRSLLLPMGDWQAPGSAYATPTLALFQGVLDGYNTLDALASLVFGILVVQAVRQYGASTETDIALATLRSGLVASFWMAVIYIFLCNIGASSVSVIGIQENGAPVLAKAAYFYFGQFGSLLLAAIVFLACITTSIGLVSSCAAYFSELLPGISHTMWVTVFSVVSFLVALFGLTTIIVAAIPVLMFLYPLTVALILLTFLDHLFHSRRLVYGITTLFTFIPALYDGLHTAKMDLGPIDLWMKSIPLNQFGLTWIPFFAAGFIISCILAACIPDRIREDGQKEI